MRISDWSSDVCSSDLRQHHRLGQRAARRAAGAARCRRRPGQRGKAMRAMTAEHRTPLIDRLPAVRGRLTENAPLAGVTWFRVGGPAEVMFRPADRDDLLAFLEDRKSTRLNSSH